MRLLRYSSLYQDALTELAALPVLATAAVVFRTHLRGTLSDFQRGSLRKPTPPLAFTLYTLQLRA